MTRKGRIQSFEILLRVGDMLRLVKPNLYLDSVLDLKPALLSELEINSLLLDMDCTLKDYTAADVGREVREWIDRLRSEQIALCLLSNGRPHRIGRLAEGLGIPFVAKAYKPLPFRCRAAVSRMRLDRRRTAVVGDQLFADVLAGNLAGLFTILVRPTSADEPWFTRLKRPLEKRVLRSLRTGEARREPMKKTMEETARDEQLHGN